MLTNKRMLQSILTAVIVIAFTFSSTGVASAAGNTDILEHQVAQENKAHNLSEAKEMLLEAATTHDLGEEISVKNLATIATQVNDIQRGINPELSGELDLSASATPVISVAHGQDITNTQGEDVYTDFNNDIDFFHQVTNSEEQVIAVLESSDSSHNQTYTLDLPENMHLELQLDGSVSILETVTEKVPLPRETERIEAAVSAILGKGDITYDDIEELTENQISQIAYIPDEATITKVVTETVGIVEEPWAIDANGVPLETHYEINGDQLTQVITPNENTAYPVVADPNITWWLQKALKCTVGVASLVAFGPAKVAFVASKIYKVLKLGKTVQLKKAFSAWQRLGKTDTVRFKTLVNEVKKFASNVTSMKNIQKAYKKSMSYKAGANSLNLLKYGGSAIADLIGIKSCVEMAKEAF